MKQQPDPKGITPTTQTVFVDGGRTDAFLPNGSLSTPFKTISAAIGYIAALGNNNVLPYTISIAAGIYQETLDFSDPALVNLTLVGYGVQIGMGGANGVAQQVINVDGNDNLTDLSFIGLTFMAAPGSAPNGMQFTSSTPGTSFASGANNGWGIYFQDCQFNVDHVLMNNLGGMCMRDCIVNGLFDVTNVIIHFFVGCSLNQGMIYSIKTDTTQPTPAGFGSYSEVELMWTQSLSTFVNDAVSVIIFAQASQQRGNVTINGPCTNRQSEIRGGITVNGTGVYKEDCGGGHSGGTLTLPPIPPGLPPGSPASPNYTQTGIIGAAAIALNGASIISGAGSPEGVVTAAPGSLYLNNQGTTGQTLWLKETGSGNTGWMAK